MAEVIGNSFDNHVDNLALFRGLVNALKDRGIKLPEPENFEEGIVRSMKVWGSSPRRGMSVDATTEAEMWNIAHFLAETIFGAEHCPEPRDRLQPNEVGMLQAFMGLALTFGGAIAAV